MNENVLYNNVIISDKKKFEDKKKNILNDGFKNLFLVSDFDRTMTHAYLETGEFIPALVAILQNENCLGFEYNKKAQDLFDKYHRIETDYSIPLNDKKKAMEEWWSKHSELKIRYGLNKSHLAHISKSNKIKFREHLDKVIKITFDNNIPFLIISASGLGDESIIYTLREHNLYFSNIDVISNKLIFDNNGFMIESVKPHIHTFNKNEIDFYNYDFFDKIKTKKNIILIGDSLGDVNMANPFITENVLKIGFLNYDINDKLEEYKKHYDVVITNDSSMEFVYDILKELNFN